MTFAMKPLSCDPSRVRGMSERLIVSHYENNYGGAVKRLNLIAEKFAELDPASAPGFLINGLKRGELIAMNSMILHELFFDGLGEQSGPGPALVHWRATSVPTSAGGRNSLPWARRWPAAPAGSC
jgi:superoxide dismutase, Fe-Mn family